MIIISDGMLFLLQGAIIIHEVYAEGAAARDARLQAGDQILEVSSNDLRNATHDEAIQVMVKLSQIYRCIYEKHHDQIANIELTKITWIYMCSGLTDDNDSHTLIPAVAAWEHYCKADPIESDLL